MAVERTGTAVTINTSSNSSSQSITVPNDATLAEVFLGVFTWDATNAAADFTATLGGSSLQSVNFSPATSTGSWDCYARLLVNPPTGSQTFAWSVERSPTYGNIFTIVFYRGVDTTSPIAASAGLDGSGSSPSITGLSYSTGDMMVGGIMSDDNAPVVTDSSQTELASTGPSAKGGGYLAVAEKASTGAFYTSSVISTGGLVAMVIRALTETGTLNQHSFRFFNDDGSESAATAKAAINTNINLSANDVARIRFLIDATNDPTTRKFQLEYRKKPSGGSFGPWTEVT